MTSMTGTWNRLGPIAWGGSVLSIGANRRGQAWLATGGAIWTATEQGWRPLAQAQPLPQVGFVGVSGRDWWASGLAGELVSTFDGGRNWSRPWTDQVTAPVTCLAVSPRYMTDATVLAGTSGAGVLRTTDAGRRWLLSNYGLRDFTILALATATDWSRRELVFAGTVEGVYRSSGGGRAWKPVGLDGFTVQALATSTSFAGNGLILAGTESAGLFRSSDGGKTWWAAGDEIGHEVSINALLRVEEDGTEAWLAATDNGQLWRSVNGGVVWALACEVDGPVLVLASGPASQPLWAGTSEHGVLASHDYGRSWAPDTSLCAWGFRRLQHAARSGILAIAPTGGVWRSDGTGRGWERQVDASLYEPLLAYVELAGAGIEARSDGLWRSAGTGEPSSVLQPEGGPIAALAGAKDGRTAWAGSSDGMLWASHDAGSTWQALDVPFAGQQLLALALSPDDDTVIVGTYAAEDHQIVLWRYVGAAWERWLSCQVDWTGLAVAASGKRGEDTWAIAGGILWAHTPEGWQRMQTPGDDAPIAGVAFSGADGARFVVAGKDVLRWEGPERWTPFPLPEDAAQVVDLCVTRSGALLCLDAAGVIWELNFE